MTIYFNSNKKARIISRNFRTFTLIQMCANIYTLDKIDIDSVNTQCEN